MLSVDLSCLKADFAQFVCVEGDNMSKQPRDDGNDPIPVLGMRPNKGHQVPFTVGASNTSPQFSESVRVVTLYSTQDAYFETGNSAVTSSNTTSHFLPATIPYDISLGAEVEAVNNPRFIAVRGDTTSGKLYISERE